MEGTFTIVVFGAVGLFFLVGILSMLTRNNLYDQIGEGGISMGEAQGHGDWELPPDSPAARAEREQEIRQMLQARSERLVRRGEQPLDIEAELASLLEPQTGGSLPGGPGGGDAGLTDEVRQLVLARNERRRRQGQEPLDVEAEVERTLRELSA